LKNSKSAFLVLSLCFILLGSIGAADLTEKPDTHSDPYIDLMLNQVAFMEGRISSLAEAIPADKYSWRPGEEVRSTGEQIVHMLSAAYFLSSMMGGEKPDHITQDLEKTLTDKTEILKNLKASFKAVTEFLKSYDTANYEKMVKTPFGEFSQRTMILIINNHYHEHLGSLITYARSNGVVPPWSEKPGEH
jgi:uncharacterized damage-inducible protein DinB